MVLSGATIREVFALNEDETGHRAGAGSCSENRRGASTVRLLITLSPTVNCCGLRYGLLMLRRRGATHACGDREQDAHDDLQSHADLPHDASRLRDDAEPHARGVLRPCCDVLRLFLT